MHEQMERRRQTSNLPEANMPDGHYLKTPLNGLLPEGVIDWPITKFAQKYLKEELYEEITENEKGDISEILEKVGPDFVNYYLKLVMLNAAMADSLHTFRLSKSKTADRISDVKFGLKLEMENTGKIGDHDNVDFFDIPWMASSKCLHILTAFQSSTGNE